MDNSMDRYLGKVLDDRYEILEVLGTGGMAVVYRALCNRLNRYVAVKILKDEFARDVDFREHFKAESHAVAMLSHPNIVSVYDFSRDSDVQYIVMELLEGITLKQYMLKKGSLSWKEALHFSGQIAKALSHAHGKGIVHRDIKPHNIMVVKDGSIKVADFGIAHLQSESAASGETMGSVHYISPEQARGDAVDARADLYSLGIVMYEMLTGQLPYEGETVESIALLHMGSAPVPPRSINPDIPLRLEEITLKAMTADIDLRYQSADELLEDLEAFRKEQTSSMSELPINEELAAKLLDSDSINIRPMKRTGELSEKSYARRKVRSRKVSTFSGFALITIFLLALVAFLWDFFIKDMFVDTQRIIIQDFVGENSNDIINSKAYENIYNFRVIYTIDPDYPEGVVISQDPEAGRSIMLTSDGIDLELTVSTGILMTKIPDLINHEYREATIALEKLGFLVEKEIVASESITEGYVVSTKPAAGDELPAGSTVYLSVSGGPDLLEVTMPALIGKTKDAAISAISQAKLELGSISEVESDFPKGTIFWQNIEAGEKVPQRTVVYLKISTGPKETEAPESEAPTAELTPPAENQTPSQPVETSPPATAPVSGGSA